MCVKKSYFNQNNINKNIIVPINLVDTYNIENIHPAEILRQFKADDIKKVLAAHILSKDENKKFEIIAVGDTDLLYDTFWTTSMTIGNNNYNIPQPGS